ncbi:DsbA family protein [Flavobacteriaceae bacterium]|nr:DsbA family protein [Flavobacteriaceae bacterium]
MKIAIFGAGIAGLSAAILLKRQGHYVKVYERSAEMNDRGNAFLMHDEGLDLLRNLGNQEVFERMGEPIQYFQMFSQKNEEVKSIRLMPWTCFKRDEVIRYLYDTLGEESIVHGYEFESFHLNGQKFTKAIFTNGEMVEADIFVGADGLHSKVRKGLFGSTQFSPIYTFELLGFVRDSKKYNQLKRLFKKFQHRSKSIAFGVLPASDGELITVLQFDPKIIQEAGILEENHKAMAEYLLADFPEYVKEVIAKQTYEETYIWKTRDFDLLPQFHKANAVLIGDSAHVALPFSSSGTTNAILDAQVLAEYLKEISEEKPDLSEFDAVFQKFYIKRAEEVSQQISFGRQLKDQFLKPEYNPLELQRIPLVKRKNIKKPRPPKEKRVQIIYFTDPICSTCWAIQPELRKLELEYGNQLEIEYRMGGLLPHWHNYNRHGITDPKQVAVHWEEVEAKSGMPINGEIWKTDPLASSYPPSIAFKAAQLQSAEKAIIFLRKIREALFVAQRDIIDKGLLYRMALSSALDAAQIIKDIEGPATDNFFEDVALSEELDIQFLPTLIMTNHLGESQRLIGENDYATFQKTINELNPNLNRMTYSKDIRDLFSRFPSMSLREYVYLSETPLEKAKQELDQMCRSGELTTWETGKVKLFLSTVKLEQGFV